MKIIAMSDLHGYLPDPETIPEVDVICICGDIVPLDYQFNVAKSIAWFELDFLPWTDKLPCKKVIFIAGNHDFFLEDLSYTGTDPEFSRKRAPKEIITDLLPGNHKSQHKLIYLFDNSVEIEGKRFYGTPWIADLQGWAFYRNDDVLKEYFSNIPKQCDVLLTHMPPDISDMGTVLEPSFGYGNNYGNKCLAEILQNRNIHYTFCGHVHSGNHNLVEYKDNCFITNVSVKDESYHFMNLYFEVYEI